MDRRNLPPRPEAFAYFLTWPTYGTWLPGDERGWMAYHQGWQLPEPVRELEARAKMTEGACLLDAEQRLLVEQTIRDHCRIRNWILHAVNCRSNHLHIAVSADCDPKRIQIQFKAWSTRRLRELERQRLGDAAIIRENWWVERGSRRYLYDEASLAAVVKYVLEGQDQVRE